LEIGSFIMNPFLIIILALLLIVMLITLIVPDHNASGLQGNALLPPLGDWAHRGEGTGSREAREALTTGGDTGSGGLLGLRGQSDFTDLYAGLGRGKVSTGTAADSSNLHHLGRDDTIANANANDHHDPDAAAAAFHAHLKNIDTSTSTSTSSSSSSSSSNMADLDVGEALLPDVSLFKANEYAIVQYDSRPLVGGGKNTDKGTGTDISTGTYWLASIDWNRRYCAQHGHTYIYYTLPIGQKCRSYDDTEDLADAWCKVSDPK
jgi:hypothetical protein